ncbi:cysteine-rich motor neuron 1 protein-like isoform X3 [Planococcus citri]|uniref:cysteine-rich motor neuron 1 protein-like isoform X3 n=1 Tax=Planococcus citri TaxID=170843 RepID=UPI0031F88D43
MVFWCTLRSHRKCNKMNSSYLICKNFVLLLLLGHSICQSSTTVQDDEPENCNSQDCNRCPPDSLLSSDGECKCDPTKCPANPVTCSPGLVRQLIRNSSTKPGYCCDVYVCVEENGKNCTGVVCSPMPSCPPDSYQLPAHKSPGDCCSIPQGCQCMPNCEMPSCEPELVLVVIERGTGEPGGCCPVYECSKPPELKHEDVVANSEPHGCRTEDGKLVENGHTWTNSDPCTACVCQNGQAVCRTYLCQACLNPVFDEKECCPTCLDTHPQPVHCPPLPNCTEPCIHGNTLNNEMCMTCNCQLKDCHLECENYMEDSVGHKLCMCAPPTPIVCPPLKNCDKSCTRGFQKDENGCDVCKCEKCPILDDCPKECSNGFDKNDKGCSICKCKPWKTRSGDANIEGSGCKTEGNIWRDDGENWFDGCRQCTCIGNKEMCSLIHCPSLLCENPIVNLTSSCCPFCPNDQLSTVLEINHMVCSSPTGSLMVEGETWMLDDCIQCICHNGRALCRSKECPPTPCSHPKPSAAGECCPVCPVSNEIEVEPFGDDIKCALTPSNSSSWREGSCTSCKCVDGKVHCYTELCDSNPKCKRSITVKNKCCSICIDKIDKSKGGDTCVFGNFTFKANDEWAIDACTKCKCVSGRMDCTQKICSQSCPNGVKKPGRCCPLCPDNPEFTFMQEMSYIALLLILICISIALVIYITRQWRYKKQQIRLRDFGCPPPQYQYKYIPTCPYDTSNPQQITNSEKASLAPV